MKMHLHSFFDFENNWKTQANVIESMLENFLVEQKGSWAGYR